MFFERYGDDGLSVSEDKREERIATLKQRIAMRRTANLESHKLHDPSSHPSKRSRSKSPIRTENNSVKLSTSDEEPSNGAVKNSRKVKKKKDSADGEVCPRKKKKKRKKKDRISDAIQNSDEISNEPGKPVTVEPTLKTQIASQTDLPSIDATKNEEEEWKVLGNSQAQTKVLEDVKRDLPDWILNYVPVDTGFSDDGEICKVLDAKLVKGLEKMGISSLFPIQKQIIPDILSGCQGVSMATIHHTPPRDICISAPTGSGKTLIYVLSLVQSLYRFPPQLQAIVVVPTKSLALQVKQVFSHFDDLLKVALISGKDSLATEQRLLYDEHGVCLNHVAVTTPGRLVHHIRDNSLMGLAHLRFLVIDEMDSLLKQSYQNWLPLLFQRVYAPELAHVRYPVKETLSLSDLVSPRLPLQKLLLSATVTHDPGKLAPLQLYQPKLYSTGMKYTLPSSLKQYHIKCTTENKPLVVLRLLEVLGSILCFTGSVDTAHRLAILAGLFEGVRVAEYSSSLTVQQRKKVVRDFSNGDINLLVCSDSLARGMDIARAEFVVNYDVPAHVQTYVHRVGRTARAGREGHAYTLVRHDEGRHFSRLLKKAGSTKSDNFAVGEEDLKSFSEVYQTKLSLLEDRLMDEKRKLKNKQANS